MSVLFWSLWGQLFGEYRYETWPSPFLGRDGDHVGLLYRELDPREGPGWYSCGFTDLVEVFYLDPYHD